MCTAGVRSCVRASERNARHHSADRLVIRSVFPRNCAVNDTGGQDREPGNVPFIKPPRDERNARLESLFVAIQERAATVVGCEARVAPIPETVSRRARSLDEDIQARARLGRPVNFPRAADTIAAANHFWIGLRWDPLVSVSCFTNPGEQ